MKLTDKHGMSRPVLKYALPIKHTLLKADFDGVDTDIFQTEWKGIIYSYFVHKNVALYVAGALPTDDGPYKLEDVPEGFGSDTPPAPRKQYTSVKKVEYEQDVNEDGTPAVNEDGSPRYKLDAEGKPVVKAKPPRAKKEPKPKAEKANGEAHSDPAAVAAEVAAQEAPTEAPLRRRRNTGGEAQAAA